MSEAVDIITAPLRLVSKALAPDAPKAPKALAPPTVDQAAEAARDRDDRRKRKGYAANLLTGSGGAEAAPMGTKQLLGE